MPEEPCWWLLPDNNIVGAFRDNSHSGRLLRSFSTDNGRSWTPLVRTNFPDAVKAGLIRVDGDPRKLDDLLSMLDTFKVMFEVVEPKTARQ